MLLISLLLTYFVTSTYGWFTAEKDASIPEIAIKNPNIKFIHYERSIGEEIKYENEISINKDSNKGFQIIGDNSVPTYIAFSITVNGQEHNYYTSATDLGEDEVIFNFSVITYDDAALTYFGYYFGNTEDVCDFEKYEVLSNNEVIKISDPKKFEIKEVYFGETIPDGTETIDDNEKSITVIPKDDNGLVGYAKLKIGPSGTHPIQYHYLYIEVKKEKSTVTVKKDTNLELYSIKYESSFVPDNDEDLVSLVNDGDVVASNGDTVKVTSSGIEIIKND